MNETQEIIEDLEYGDDVTTVAERHGLTTTDDYEGDADGHVIVLPGWMADDGNAEVEYPDASSGHEAAQEYVDGGDWGEAATSTQWVDVWAWQTGIGLDEGGGEVVYVRVGRESHTIEIEPEEPDCIEGHDHQWCAPHRIVGGIKENPGVWVHGGGAVIHEVCPLCGCGRTIDTWAQRPDTGQQGLTSVEYCEGEYADEVEVPEGWRIFAVEDQWYYEPEDYDGGTEPYSDPSDSYLTALEECREAAEAREG